MKKRFFILLVLFMAFITTSCSSSPTLPPPLSVTERGDLEKAFETNSDACEIVHTFYSLADLKTFLSGSRNPEDYENPPSLLNSSAYRTYVDRYLALETIFNEEDTLQAPNKITTKLTRCYYTYWYDHFNILVKVAPPVYNGNSASDYFAKKAEKYQSYTPFDSTTVMDFASWKENPHPKQPGYVIRTVGGYEAIYEYEDQQLRSITLIVDGCLIAITRIIPYYESDSAERFGEFMTNKEHAAVTPFFSEDDEVYTRALAKLVTGVRAKTEADLAAEKEEG